MKINNKQKTFLAIMVCILLLGIFFAIKKTTKITVGKVVNGKVEYIDRISSVTFNKEKNIVTIEFKNNQELIDNCIMTSKL